MRTGKTINELATEVTLQRSLSRDFRVEQNVLELGEDHHIRTIPGKTAVDLDIVPSELFHGQLAEKLGVPVKYYNRMKSEAPELLRSNVNTWLQKDSDKRFLRTFSMPQDLNLSLSGEGKPLPRSLNGRAFLGAGYKPLDNYDLIEALFPPLMNSGLALRSADVTETKLYLQLATEKLTATVHGAKKGDIVQLGLVVSNSEVGNGALSIQVLVYRLACLNGLILPADIDLPGFRKIHVGAGLSRTDASFTEVTQRLTDAAIWAQARDLITSAVRQATLDKVADRLNGIAQVKLANPEKAVEEVAKRFDLLENERTGVMANLIAGGDVSQWGLTNAVTALAHTAQSYDRAVELETIGGKVATLNASIFGVN